LFILLCAGASGQENRFVHASLERNGGRLLLQRADGSQSAAPKLEGQDSFGEPAIASNRRYAGWLAIDSNHGASSSQPLYLVVMDGSNRLHRFRSDFGMVFGWCFSRRGTEVVFRSEFPHGPSPVEYQMRRISDGKLLRRFKVGESSMPDGEEATRPQPRPSWAKCAAASQGTQ
jgi:hypothetical protein